MSRIKRKPELIRKAGETEVSDLGRSPRRMTPPQDPSGLHQDTDPDISCETQQRGEKPPLAGDDFEVLRKMVQDYKSHRIDFSNLRRRPKFRGPRVNSGIAINAEIKRRAVERAKADPDGTGGGNLSGLIELLLWTFLGCPDDVVDRGPRQ